MQNDSYQQTRWSLEDLLPAPEGPKMDQLLTELEKTVAALEGGRDLLTPSIAEEDFHQLVTLVERISTLSSRLRGYASLWYTEDTQHQDALAYRGRIDRLLTEVRNRALFFTLWWKAQDEAAASRLLPIAGDNAYYLESLRRFAPHTLSELEEKVINLKNVTGVQALVTVYEMLTNSFTFNVEIDGQPMELTRSELSVYARDPRPEVREAIYRELYRVYGEQGTVLGQIYQYVARDWASENISLRNFSSPVAVRNLSNDVPDAVVDTLLKVCRDNAKLFQQYFRLKAGWLGMDTLRRYDIYAPLSTSDKTFPFHEAATMVLDSLHDFSPTLADLARRVFADGHIDSEIRPRKYEGAFCYGVLPAVTPWVLVNFTGKARDVATLAHELGHAVHALMAADHSALTFHASLPLAETASTVSEMLLFDRLMADETDAAVRRDLLVDAVDDVYATVVRQAYFVLFEREAHAMVEESKSTDALAQRYLVNLAEQFGDAVEVSDEFRWEWVSIPHIYRTPFYCYAYSFGQLLALALYQRYREEGQSFVPGFLRLLAQGGSASPATILGEAGVDMADAAFWQGGFDVIADMIRELQTLADGEAV
jgi:oligoendopeptidase F